MTTPFLAGDLARDEGLRLWAYPDPLSPRGKELAKPPAERDNNWDKFDGRPWTIGYGHTGPEVHEGLTWTLEQANAALISDKERAEARCDRFCPWWRAMNDARQDVLANMMFNMGWDDPKTPRLEGLSSFVNTLGYMKLGDYERAAEGMLASAWAMETGGRAQRLATQMRTGVRKAS